jgi:hypothetical protein
MQNENIDIIIIRGAPASGKSHTAKSLSQFFPKGVRIEVDNLRNMVISVDWKNQNEHINILNLSTKLVVEYLQLGFKPVIIVDTFSGDKILKYLTDLKQLNEDLSIKIFGLYTTDEELKKRTDLRGSEEFRDLSICLRLNSDVLKYKHQSEYQINTTGLLPIETAKLIYEQSLNEA